MLDAIFLKTCCWTLEEKAGVFFLKYISFFLPSPIPSSSIFVKIKKKIVEGATAPDFSV